MRTETGHRGMVRTLPIRIDGAWAAEDFSDCFDALDAFYLYSVVGSEDAATQAEELSRSMWEGCVVRVPGRGLGRIPPSIPTGLWRMLADKSVELVLLAEDIRRLASEPTRLEWRGLAVHPTLGVGVRSIRYGSPGEINVRGLGEPLEQMRELLKDLMYRNRLERDALRVGLDAKRDEAAGQREMQLLELEEKRLEILRDKLAILRGLGLPDHSVARALLGPQHVQTVVELTSRGMICELGEIEDD